MKTVRLTINSKQVEAEEGTTILQAARENGIEIPSLCAHPQLRPHGACRLCMVEIAREKSRGRLVASCVYQVQPGLEVDTDTDRVLRIRRTIVELMWPTLPKLAAELGVTESRFHPERTDCNLCGLCVRYCAEVKKLNAAYFSGRGIDRHVAVVPELGSECLYCRECFDLCPGGLIVSRYDEQFQTETGELAFAQ
jgi:bidirectional [NiFe] hydrogenase diaphorase subunit